MFPDVPPALDTLEIAKRLKTAGFAEAQAEALTGILHEAREADLSRLATKDDHVLLRAEFAAFKSAIEAEFAAFKSAIEAEFAAFRAQVKADNEILRRDLTIRMGGMIVIATGVLLAAKFFG